MLIRPRSTADPPVPRFERPPATRSGTPPATAGQERTRPTVDTGGPARWRRLAGISASLVGTNAVTSILGLGFWTAAARTLDPAAVGVAGAAVALMMLLGTLSTLGLGTLLISRLPAEAPATRRRLVRSCLALAAGVAGVLSLITVWPAISLFGVDHLRPVVATPLDTFGFALATALTAVTMVLDQAVLVLGIGALQLERNLVASTVKIATLIALAGFGDRNGMAVVLAWTAGNAVSLPLVAYRTRRGRRQEQAGPVIDLRVLRGLGPEAISHHALNLGLQLPLQLLPVVVTVLLSARDNGYFSTALLVTGFVFTLPYAVSVGIFAAAEGDEREVLNRLRWTVPFGLAVSLVADVVLYPIAGPVLSVFGQSYATQSTPILRMLVLAGLPFVIKDHYVALRRVQHRTGRAAAVIACFSVGELAAAAAGAHWGGVLGLCWAWVGLVTLEAAILTMPLLSGARALHGLAPVDAPAAPPPRIPVELPQRDLLAATLAWMSAGLAVSALAAACARTWTPTPWLSVVYAAGLAMIFLPAAVRVAYSGTAARERIIVALALPALLQLIRFALHPSGFAYHDELVHQNTLRLIGETHHLFSENSLLPVSGYYPGMEIVTHAVGCLTGLGPLASAGVVLLLARLVIAAALIALITAITHSARAGAIASVVYTCNPQLIFFNSQFSYQTLALPLAVLTVYLLFAARDRRGAPPFLTCTAALIAVAMTHHLTSMLLVATLALWSGLEFAFGHHRRAAGEAPVLAPILAGLTGAGVLIVTAVAANPNNPVGGYLLAIIHNSRSAVDTLRSGQSAKVLFADPAGSSSQLWEQVLMVYAVGVVGIVLIPALFRARTWWRRRVSLALILILAALLYPVIPLGHLTRATAEVGDRACGFAFLGIAFVLGWAVCDLPIARRWAAIGGLLATGVFVGNAILGAGPIGRQLPGPYEVSADAHSLDAHNLTTAQWISRNLPPGSRVYADRDSGLLAAAVGGHFTVRHVSTGVDASRLLLDPQFTHQDVAVARAARIAYVIVDLRDATSLPHQGVYVEDGEFGQATRTRPVPRVALTKLERVAGVQKIYDDGSLMIYDIRRISNVP